MVLAAKIAVVRTRNTVADNGDRELVSFAEDALAKLAKRQAWKLAFCADLYRDISVFFNDHLSFCVFGDLAQFLEAHHFLLAKVAAECVFLEREL